MEDLNVIDRFVQTFSAYIDSGFGLVAPDVAFLTSTLIAIDIALAGVFWALGPDTDVIARFLKKVLYVGFFALLLGNFAALTQIVFESFAGLGLNASGSPLTAEDIMRPGFVAAAGYDAALPLLDEIHKLTGPVAFFTNIVIIAVLFLAWLITLVSFFFLAIQLFVTIMEFKLTTLAGFVLVPFALWNKTSFLAEKVLGNVIASGIKLMVLAIIIGIGSTIFSEITSTFEPDAVTLEQAASIILGSLALLGLGIFGPAIANGLVAGAPQLGAGAAFGTVAGAAAGGMAAGGLARAGAGGLVSSAGRAMSAAASMAGGARTSFSLAQAASGESGFRGAMVGLGGVASAGAASAGQAFGKAFGGAGGSLSGSYKSGSRSAFAATGGSGVAPSPETAGPDTAPDWARRIRQQQLLRDSTFAAMAVARDGDRPGHAEAPRLRPDED